MGITKKIYRV